MNTLCRFVIINKLFPAAIGSQRNSTLISYKKRFQEETANNQQSMSLDGTPLNQVHVVKFLGIFLDENLSWKSHISYICKKISKSAGIIFRSRFYLSTKTKLLLY